MGVFAEMKTLAIIFGAYLITGIHFVGRDLQANIAQRPAYLRSRSVALRLIAVLAWLPTSLATPSAYGWDWISLKPYFYSICMFVVLVLLGLGFL